MKIKHVNNIPAGSAVLYIAPNTEITVMVASGADRTLSVPEALVFALARAVVVDTRKVQQFIDEMLQDSEEYSAELKMVDEIADDIKKEMQDGGN